MKRTEGTTGEVIARNNQRARQSRQMLETMANMPTTVLIGAYPAGVLYKKEDEANQWLSKKGHSQRGYRAFADLDDGLDTRSSGRLNLSAPKGTDQEEVSGIRSQLARRLG